MLRQPSSIYGFAFFQQVIPSGIPLPAVYILHLPRTGVVDHSTAAMVVTAVKVRLRLCAIVIRPGQSGAPLTAAAHYPAGDFGSHAHLPQLVGVIPHEIIHEALHGVFYRLIQHIGYIVKALSAAGLFDDSLYPSLVHAGPSGIDSDPRPTAQLSLHLVCGRGDHLMPRPHSGQYGPLGDIIIHFPVR